MSEINKTQYLNRLQDVDSEFEFLRKKQLEERKALKIKFAHLFEEARLQAGISIIEVANKLGKSRQSVHQIILDVYGVRHPDKSERAKLGHETRKNKQ